jgi:UDP-N-acetylglucosamine 2-epimerase (non-hydrolysing)
LPKVISLVGARPQFVKEAMIYKEVRRLSAWDHVLVHSGQHYDASMSGAFFDQLSIKNPDHSMDIGSGSHGAMTARALERFEAVLLKERPDMVLVYGDTNTTVAGALAASKLKIPVAHVEAGIRQNPKDMPEEINRVVTDHLSRHLFTCSQTAADNLAKEGITQGVHNVGDVMYDLFLMMRSSFDGAITEKLGLKPNRFVLVTLHRDFNVDDERKLGEILKGLSELGKALDLEIVFPAHPRTSKRIEEFGLSGLTDGIKIVPPVGYFQLMGLAENCAFAVTDSGGFQKEAVFAEKKALVIMPDTGWRELTDCGWNLLAEPNSEDIVKKGLSIAQTDGTTPPTPYGDGHAAEKIVLALRSILKGATQ